ncbi:hypothetical protein D3C76_1163100 [compost metagenome]
MAKAAGRVARQGVGLGACRVRRHGEGIFGHRRHDPARAHRVAAHLRAVVDRDGAGQPMHERFRGVVDRHGRVGGLPGDRAQVDDRATLPEHARQRRPTQVEGAAGVDPHDFVPIGIGAFQHGLLDLHTRVVDQHAHPAAALLGALDDVAGICSAGYIGLHPFHRTIQMPGPGATPAGDHLPPQRHEFLDDGQADTAAATCYDHG